MDDIAKTVKAYLIREYGVDDGMGNDEPLFSGGILDSIDVIALLAFIEKTYKIKFDPFNIGLEQLDSVALIAKSIKNHLK